MAYLRSVDDESQTSGVGAGAFADSRLTPYAAESSLGEAFGCGPGCGCDNCRRGSGRISGLEEYYVPEEEDEPAPPTPPQIPQRAGRINGFGWYGEPAPRLRRPRAEPRLRMPVFETVTGFTPGAADLSAAESARINHAADFIVRSWDRASPITSVRITGYIDRNEWQPELGQHRAAAVRDALMHTLDSLRPKLAERLRWIIEDRGLSTQAKVEIYLWAGPTAPPVPPLVRIPSPAEAARSRGPAMLRPRFGEPAPTTLRMRPKPYLKLDWFEFDKASLTPRLADMVIRLADTAVKSLSSPQPIEIIRLIGHTDSSGTEKYNIGLGDRRAHTIAALLRDKLKGLSGRIKIVVEPSPGETDPTADNGTADGRGLNRRVEVFIKTGSGPAPKPKPPINLWDPNVIKPPPEPVMRRKPEPYWDPIPPGPKGKSFKEWLDGKLKEYRVPKILRDQIWDAIFDKNWGLLSNLLGAAGISGPVKESIIETARAGSEGKAR